MGKNTVLIIASVSFADEKGVMRYAGDKVEISQEMLDKQNELCEKFDLPKHTVVETAKETKPAKFDLPKHTVVETAKETKPKKEDDL